MNGQATGRAVAIDELLTIGEVADRLRVNERTIRRRIAEGELSFIAIGGRRLIEARELSAYVSRNRRRVVTVP